MVTEAMEQEQRHDHDEEEDTTEDSFGATVILGKGEYLLYIYVDWSSFSHFWHLSNCVEGTYLEKLVALQPLKNYLNLIETDSSLWYSQTPATGPFPGPDKSHS